MTFTREAREMECRTTLDVVRAALSEVGVDPFDAWDGEKIRVDGSTEAGVTAYALCVAEEHVWAANCLSADFELKASGKAWLSQWHRDVEAANASVCFACFSKARQILSADGVTVDTAYAYYNICLDCQSSRPFQKDCGLRGGDRAASHS